MSNIPSLSTFCNGRTGIILPQGAGKIEAMMRLAETVRNETIQRMPPMSEAQFKREEKEFLEQVMFSQPGDAIQSSLPINPVILPSCLPPDEIIPGLFVGATIQTEEHLQ